MEIRQRLAIFYHRLADAPAVVNAEQAFALICRVLEQVEDEFCTVARTSPPPRHFVGRMYSPLHDSIEVLADQSWRVSTRRHLIVIRPDGSFSIYLVVTKDQLVEEFSKLGSQA